MAAGPLKMETDSVALQRDFGDDLPLLLHACGFTALQLPSFQGPLSTPEVAKLRAELLSNPQAFEDWMSLMKLVEKHGTEGEKVVMCPRAVELRGFGLGTSNS